jgi:hypothetical protein
MGRSPRYTVFMADDFAQTLSTVAAGRTAVVARLRALATQLEDVPLESVAEVLVLLHPGLEAFERQATLALERAPGGPR